MYNLSFPVPVTLFLHRLLKVVSSATIASQYFFTNKVEFSRKDGTSMKQPTVGGVTKRHENVEKIAAHISGEYLNTCIYCLQLFNALVFASNVDHFDAYACEDGRDRVLRTPNTKLIATDFKVNSLSFGNPRKPLSTIQTLMMNPILFDPVRRPRNPIVLCHGTPCK